MRSGFYHREAALRNEVVVCRRMISLLPGVLILRDKGGYQSDPDASDHSDGNRYDDEEKQRVGGAGRGREWS